MQYNHDEVKLIAGYTLADYQRERETTKRVIAAIPEGKADYSPDSKSMSAFKLARHIASSELFFLNGILTGEFKSEDPMPASVRTTGEILAWYETSLNDAIESTKAASGELLSRRIDFFGKITLPAVGFLSLMLKHSVHHRGQLSAYLRAMGGKVPSIYGPSGDDQ
jgi:uncharacterized damage-inducible protein DinB